MDATQVYVAEFVGTAILLAFGTSTNASLLLNCTLVQVLKMDWLGLIFGWCFAVTFGVYAALFLYGPGHLNPALTIAFAIGGLYPWKLVAGTIVAQVAGAFFGAAITSLHYYPHFKVTPADEGNNVGIFATGPSRETRVFNLLSEIVATFFFLFVALLLGPMVKGLVPLIFGFLVASIGLSFGSTTGFAINPARDFGPRLAYYVLPIPNKGTANWPYAWVPIVGPIIGASCAMLAFQYLVVFLQLK